MCVYHVGSGERRDKRIGFEKQHEKMFIKNKLTVGLTCLVALRSNFLQENSFFLEV